MRFFRRKNWEEELSAYLDGELSEADRGELEALLRERPELRVRLEELRGLKSLFSAAAREQSPLDLWPGVRAKILAKSGGRGVLPVRESLLVLLPQLGGRLVPALCALVLVVSVALLAFHSAAPRQELPPLASASPLSLSEEEIFLGGAEETSPESILQFIMAPGPGEELP